MHMQLSGAAPVYPNSNFLQDNNRADRVRIYSGHPTTYLLLFFQLAEITAQLIKSVLIGMMVDIVKEFMITFVGKRIKNVTDVSMNFLP